jgi:DNA-binding IclR family transcriptional regulator
MNTTIKRATKDALKARATPAPAATTAQAASVEAEGGVQAVVFALQILEHVAKQRESVRVTDLAEAFGTNKNKIFRHLRTLMQQGYVVQDETSEQYRIGTRLVALGRAVSENFDLGRLASSAMATLRAQVGQSVVLSQFEADGMRVVSVARSESPIEIVVKPGSLLGFHNSAQGKIALAFGSKALLDQVCAGDLPASTRKTLTSAQALRENIEQVRTQGWSVAPDETAIGLNALAAPLLDATGALAGSVAIVDLTQNLAAMPSQEQIRSVVAAAKQISKQLGFKGAGQEAGAVT